MRGHALLAASGTLTYSFVKVPGLRTMLMAGTGMAASLVLGFVAIRRGDCNFGGLAGDVAFVLRADFDLLDCFRVVERVGQHGLIFRSRSSLGHSRLKAAVTSPRSHLRGQDLRRTLPRARVRAGEPVPEQSRPALQSDGLTEHAVADPALVPLET